MQISSITDTCNIDWCNLITCTKWVNHGTCLILTDAIQISSITDACNINWCNLITCTKWVFLSYTGFVFEKCFTLCFSESNRSQLGSGRNRIRIFLFIEIRPDTDLSKKMTRILDPVHHYVDFVIYLDHFHFILIFYFFNKIQNFRDFSWFLFKIQA